METKNGKHPLSIHQYMHIYSGLVATQFKVYCFDLEMGDVTLVGYPVEKKLSAIVWDLHGPRILSNSGSY